MLSLFKKNAHDVRIWQNLMTITNVFPEYPGYSSDQAKNLISASAGYFLPK